MGKSIDLSQPLSDEDRAWLESHGKYGDLRVAAEFARAADEPVSPVEEQVSEPEDETDVEGSEYGTWTNAQLRYELGTRDLPQYGTKAELVARLEEADSGAESEQSE